VSSPAPGSRAGPICQTGLRPAAEQGLSVRQGCARQQSRAYLSDRAAPGSRAGTICQTGLRLAAEQGLSVRQGCAWQQSRDYLSDRAAPGSRAGTTCQTGLQPVPTHDGAAATCYVRTGAESCYVLLAHRIQDLLRATCTRA
jgi:hypothetical protein